MAPLLEWRNPDGLEAPSHEGCGHGGRNPQGYINLAEDHLSRLNVQAFVNRFVWSCPVGDLSFIFFVD